MPGHGRSVDATQGLIPLNTDPEAVQDYNLNNMTDAMRVAMLQVREPANDDPDPYGYGQELEENYGVDLLAPQWKAKPDDTRWVKRLRARARKVAIARLFLLGKTPHEIAEECNVGEVTVYKDLHVISQEWRRTYLDDIEQLAGKDLARLDYMLSKLAVGIDAGDTKSITAAIDIIKERAAILGYRQGIQVDIEQYVREVAEANGFDPERAVQFAQRISVSYKG